MLYSRSSGEGKPLVLLHGLFGSMENLGALARHLKDQFAVYSVDLPNHGRSAHTDNMNLQSMALQVLDWIRAQGLDSVYLVGHSLGGKVAMELALLAPERIHKLVVIDIAPVTYSARHDDVFAGLLAIDPALISSRDQADALMAAHVADAAIRSFLLKNLVKQGDGFSWRMNLPELHASYLRLIESNRDDINPLPTLFLKGADSNYILEKYRQPTLARFPNAQVKVIAGTGHWLHAEKPDLVARTIKKFLAQ